MEPWAVNVALCLIPGALPARIAKFAFTAETLLCTLPNGDAAPPESGKDTISISIPQKAIMEATSNMGGAATWTISVGEDIVQFEINLNEPRK